MGNLHARSWLGTVENYALDQLLGRSYKDQYIRDIFPTELEIVQWHSCPAAILTSLLKVVSVLEKDVRVDVITYGSGNLRYFPWSIVRPITV